MSSELLLQSDLIVEDGEVDEVEDDGDHHGGHQGGGGHAGHTHPVTNQARHVIVLGLLLAPHLGPDL